jgi:GTPase
MDLDRELPTKHLKLGIIGNVDAGKSTLVAVLTKGMPDDGNGIARGRICNYRHEQETGRTSSIGQEIMGFSVDGSQVIPERFNQNKNKYWKEIVKDSYKIVSLVDLCGHEKYLKTTINGLTGLAPDFSCVVVGANMGLSKMTR